MSLSLVFGFENRVDLIPMPCFQNLKNQKKKKKKIHKDQHKISCKNKIKGKKRLPIKKKNLSIIFNCFLTRHDLLISSFSNSYMHASIETTQKQVSVKLHCHKSSGILTLVPSFPFLFFSQGLLTKAKDQWKASY